MQTGCDSYWMYQNNTPEPLLNLSNNVQYNYAGQSGSNKQMQNRRIPSLLSTCIQPPSNTAYYHQNNQCRRSDYQEIWPSSVYSMPFKSSYMTNNTHLNGSANWSSNSEYMYQNSYAHQHSRTRHSRNHGNLASVNSINSSGNPKISRIRVKDVQSINNNRNNSTSSALFNDALLQTQSNVQNNNIINYVSNNFGTANNSNPQREFIDNAQLPNCKPPPPYYAHTATEHLHSAANFEISRPSVVVSKAPVFESQEMLPSGVSHIPEIQGMQNVISNIVPRTSVMEQLLEKTICEQLISDGLTYGMSTSCSISQVQNSHQNESENGVAYLPSLTAVNTPTTNINTQVTSNPTEALQNHVQRDNDTLIKISIPHTGQSSFIRLNDSNSANSNSGLSLPCLLESNDRIFNEVTQDTLASGLINTSGNVDSSVLQATSSEVNIPPVPVESCQNSSSSSLSSLISFRKKTVNPKEPVINVSKENVNNFIPPIPQNEVISQTESSNVSKEANSEQNILLNLLTLKQEKFLTSAESLQRSDDSISENNELSRVIKTEETPEEHSNISEDFLPPAQEETRNDNFSEVNTLPSKKTEESELKSVQKDQNVVKKSKLRKIKYKSKIDRAKLDMLIQFLEKDDEPVQANLKRPGEETLNENSNHKSSTNEKQSRRKLSKTCIVKNKNISREMVSLISHKSNRVEPLKSSSETSDIVKSNIHSDRLAVGSENSGSTHIENENFTSAPESHPNEENSFKSPQKIRNELVTKEAQKPNFEHSPEDVKEKEGEENKTLINRIQALSSKSTNYCPNCNLNLSIESFWVNVISFELKCLNCFKKSTSKEDINKNNKHEIDKEKVNTNVKDTDNSNCYFKTGKKAKENCNKERSAEQQKISKNPSTEKLETPSKESCTGNKSKTPERSKSKEKSLNIETKSKSGSHDLEKKKSLKRKHSVDDISPSKVRILENQTKKEGAQVTHQSDKPKSGAKVSKDEIKNEKQVSKNSTFKPKTKDFLKHVSQKLKSPDQKYGIDDSEKSPRRKSNEEGNVKKSEISKELSRNEIKQTKEKKCFTGKIPKISTKKDNPEKPTENGQPQKQAVESKPLKENQNKLKGEKYQSKEYHEDKRKTEEKKKMKKEDKEEEYRKGNIEKYFHQKGTEDKSQRENKCLTGSKNTNDRPSIGWKEGPKDFHGSKDVKKSATLLNELIRKTKKLSWSLLGET